MAEHYLTYLLTYDDEDDGDDDDNDDDDDDDDEYVGAVCTRA